MGELKRIRIGNDFQFLWRVEKAGVAVDLTAVHGLEITVRRLSGGGSERVLPKDTYRVSGNDILIDFTTEFLTEIGEYRLILKFARDDGSMLDGDRDVAIDITPFIIVPTTASADKTEDFEVTSDIAIAFEGESAYSVWLRNHTGTVEDFYAWMREPATSAGQQVDTALQSVNSTMQGVNSTMQAIEQDEQTRAQNEQDRVNAESDRVVAEGLRQTNTAQAIADAESAAENANTAAQSANEAADSALTATQEATTAASLADTARLAIQDDLAQKANHGYDSNPKTLKQVDDRLEELSNNWTKNW